MNKSEFLDWLQEKHQQWDWSWLAVSPVQAIIIGILGWGAAGPIVFLMLANVFVRTQSMVRETPAS